MPDIALIKVIIGEKCCKPGNLHRTYLFILLDYFLAGLATRTRKKQIYKHGVVHRVCEYSKMIAIHSPPVIL